jgi:phosphatidylglycerophosphate synthase
VPFVVACEAALSGGNGLTRILPAVIFAVAAATDFFDGRVARRAGTASGRGQLFDHVTDVVFIGTGLVFFASAGRLSWWVPAAVGGAIMTYAHALWHDGREARDPSAARSTIGHAAGVLNYALVGVLAAELVWSATVPRALVSVIGALTIMANGLAVIVRLWGRLWGRVWPRPHIRPRPALR